MKNKVIVYLLFIGFMFLGSFGGIGIYYNAVGDVLEKETSGYFNAIAESRMDHIETFFELLKARIVDFSSDGKIKDCLDVLNRGVEGCNEGDLVRHLVENKIVVHDSLLKVFVLDANGEIVASTNVEDIGLNHFGKDYFLNAKQEPYIDDIASLDLENKRSLLVSALVKKGDTGEFLGVIVTVFSLDLLNDIVTDRTGLGDTGEIVLAYRDENGDAVFFTDRRFEGDLNARSVIPKEELDVPITQALLKRSGPLLNYVDYRGNVVFSEIRYIEETDWGLVAKIDKREAVGLLRIESIKSGLLILIGITILVGVFVLISNRFILGGRK